MLSTPPGATNVLRWASGSESEEAARFLQRRVALYAGLVGGLFAVMYVMGLVALGLAEPAHVVEIHLHPAKVMHAAVCVLFLGAHAVLRGDRPRSGTLVRAIDAGGPVALSVAVAWATGRYLTGYHLEWLGTRFYPVVVDSLLCP